MRQSWLPPTRIHVWKAGAVVCRLLKNLIFTRYLYFTVNIQQIPTSSTQVQNLSGILLNLYCEVHKLWEFTKWPPWSVKMVGIYTNIHHRNGGDLLNVHREVLKWGGSTLKRWGFVKLLILTLTAPHTEKVGRRWLTHRGRPGSVANSDYEPLHVNRNRKANKLSRCVRHLALLSLTKSVNIWYAAYGRISTKQSQCRRHYDNNMTP